MNKLLIAIALCTALVACKKDEAAPAADPVAAPDAMAPAADPAPMVQAGLPKECEDYLNRAKACFAKANPAMASAFQKSLDDSKAQWDAMTDKAGLASACTTANDQFSQAVAALKCE